VCAEATGDHAAGPVPAVRNDPDAAERVRRAFQAHFGEERIADTSPISASEDFGSFGSEWHVPSVFWTVGGTNPDTYQAQEAGRLSELPTNHNPRFAPMIHPTLETGGGDADGRCLRVARRHVRT
jgi:metal-dependent amidase/aminoacylase/carboxypeptidase family protein